jgi:3-oxoacyl-[acyl-carrier protein] reductase
MARQKKGSIIIIASIAGIDGDPAQLEYSASKAALICATKKLAFELGPSGLRVNAIAPGTTETKMIDMMAEGVKREMAAKVALGRLGKPSEIADLCYYLASDESSYITGQTIRIDGGIMVNTRE